MPNFNPFNSDDEGTSFEQGLPVSQAAKSVVKSTSSQVAGHVNAAAKKAADDVIDFLYAPTEPQEAGTDEANTQHSDASNAATRAVSSSQTGAHKSSNANQNQNANQSPDDQAQMERIRHELFGNYAAKFKSAQNGAQNITTDLEQEMEKARQERKQKEMQRKQEEEEEERRKKEEEERRKQEEVALPAGKKTGFQMGKKQQQPMSVHLSRIKTEGNRGTSG